MKTSMTRTPTPPAYDCRDDKRPVMVTVRCIAYNQERYIRQCLESLVTQVTDFRYVAVVHDDASTDHTADIIREYEERYPHIIKAVYERENLYQRHDGSLMRRLDAYTQGRYVAICEGDDFWTDPLKLQKQYDYMETHPQCSLCFHAHERLLPSGKREVQRPRRPKPVYTAEDVLLAGGRLMATDSMFYRWEHLAREGRPDFWNHCDVGDLPSMLFAASKGTLDYIDEVMSVYRKGATGSWSERQQHLAQRTAHYKSILRLYDEYDAFTGFRYHRAVIAAKRKRRRKYLKKVAVARLKGYFSTLTSIFLHGNI